MKCECTYTNITRMYTDITRTYLQAVTLMTKKSQKKEQMKMEWTGLRTQNKTFLSCQDSVGSEVRRFVSLNVFCISYFVFCIFLVFMLYCDIIHSLYSYILRVITCLVTVTVLLYRIVLCYIAFHCIELYCIVLNFIPPNFIVLFCIVFI